MHTSQRTVLTFFTALSLTFLLGCGSDHTDGGSQTGSFSYSIENGFNGNNCKYQSPAYSSMDEYCRALQNSLLNVDPSKGRECGRYTRKGIFERDCPGTFTPFQE